MVAPTGTPTATATSTVAATATATATLTPTVTATRRPTATPRPTATATPEPVRYVVKSGDTLTDIAAEFGVTVEAIVALNSISNPARLQLDQVLKIPPPE